MNLPLLGMGTWGMGGRFEQESANRRESIDALRYGLELGIRLIDVAEIYGAGLSEKIVGEAIKGFPRDEVFIISKVWKEHLRYDAVLRAARASLERLGADYLDLYLVHWQNPAVPLQETMKAMEKLVKEGLAREIGVSNFDVPLMREAQTHLSRARLFANQIEYNLAARAAEKEVIPFCKAQGMRVIAYRPLAKGAIPNTANALLAELAARYGKTPAQVALNWVVSKGMTAIPKAGRIAHIKENLGSLGWRLSPEDSALLDDSHF
ncbi:MAG: aldo/keto reductase [Patescibacteria group bacterium]